MTGSNILPTQQRRLCVALAIVVVLVFAAPLVDAVRGALGAQDMVMNEPDGFQVTAGDDFFATLEDVERQVDSTLDTPSKEFMDEVGLLSGADDVRVSKEGDTVGYSLEGTAPSVIEELDERFESKGWTPVSLGGAIDGNVYLKSEGVYTWMLVTATQVGGTVSVVIRCPIR